MAGMICRCGAEADVFVHGLGPRCRLHQLEGGPAAARTLLYELVEVPDLMAYLGGPLAQPRSDVATVHP